MKSQKIFLFDLDGTLITTEGAGLKALEKTFNELFNVFNVLDVVSPSGKTDPAIFREIFQKKLYRDLSPKEMAHVSENYLKHLAADFKNHNPTTALEGVVDFLTHLQTRDDIFFGLGTGNIEKGAKIKLTPTGLWTYFEFGGFGSDSEDRADMLRIGRTRGEEKHNISISPENVYVIGDTELDVAAAKKAGFKSIAVASGGKSMDELKLSHPDFLIEDMGQALPLLEVIERRVLA